MLCSSLQAQTSLRFQHIDREEGLSHSTVSDILQDRLGFMWFTTIDGLNCYDGYRSVISRHDPADPQSLSSSFLHCLAEDGLGNLWIATRDGGLNLLTPENRNQRIFKHYLPRSDDPHSLSHRHVQTLYVDRHQQVWVGTQNGLDRYVPDKDHFEHIPLFGGEPTIVTGLTEDSQGRLWVSTWNGLYQLPNNRPKLTPQTLVGQARHFPADSESRNSLTDNRINHLFCDSADRLWLAMRGNGLTRLDLPSMTFKHYPPNPNNGLAAGNARVAHEEASGQLWIGTDSHGLYLLNPETDEFRQFRHQPTRTDSLSNDNVTQIYRSRDGTRGTLWVATWGGGVNKLVDDHKPFELYRHDPENADSLSGNFVFSIGQDRFGDFWIGTIGGGLNHWNPRTHTWRRFTHQPNQPQGISDNTIWCVYRDTNGDMLFGTEQGGMSILSRTDPEDPFTFTRITQAQGLFSNNIRRIFRDDTQTLWLGSNERGLARSTPSGYQVFQNRSDDPTSLSDNCIQTMLQTRDGQLWIGTHNGLNSAVPQADLRFTRYTREDPNQLGNNDIRDLYEDENDRLWIATYGGGLHRFEPETNRFTRFTQAEGLSNDFLYAIEAEGPQRLWLSSNSGLTLMDTEKTSFRHFSTQHGLQADEFNTGSSFRAEQGHLLFGGVNGLNRFHPEQLQRELQLQQSQPPPVYLTRFVVMGQPRPLTEEPMRLRHTDKFFSFEWAALDYLNPAKNSFAYRLDGFDNHWIDNGFHNFATYTNLDPGSYTLRLKSADNHGVWQEAAPFQIEIPPPFWETWWFRLLLFPAAVLGIFLGLRVREFYLAWRGTRYVAHFKLIKELGMGGSGTVYLAQNRLQGNRVALKVLSSRMEETPDGVRRFLQEAEIGGRLSHPNIVIIFEAGSRGKTRFIAMEYLEGQTLAAFLNGPLPQEQLLPLALQILAGLQAIHELGIVHRDLKAANVMILPNLQVKIMDFGLARMSTLTTVENQGQIMGTLAYMAPEQTLGKTVNVRADIYAIGVLIYQMHKGRLPFQAENQMSMIYAIHNEAPPHLDETHPLEQIIARCLEKAPENRFASAEALSEALICLAKPKAPKSA